MATADLEDPSRRAVLALAALGASTGPATSVAAQAMARDAYASSGSEYLIDPALTYLNTGSVGPTPRAVIDRMVQVLIEVESNPVRMIFGQGSLRLETDRARDSAAALIGCAAENLQITRNTTEAMSSVALGMRLEAGDRVLTTDQEHHGGSLCWTHVARRRGAVVDVVPISPDDHDPHAILDRFDRAMTPKTRVVSVSHVITSTGYLMPIPEIAALARARGALCVVDGAQALGQIAVDVRALGCHAYAASGHKWLMGPKGTGLLYVSPDATDAIQPIQTEDNRRFISESVGTGCLPLAIGLGGAIETVRARGQAAVTTHSVNLRNRAYEGLRAMPMLSLASVAPGPRATAMVAARLPDRIDSADFRTALLERHGVVVKMVEKRWFNGIRLSPHVFNTESDIERALRAIAQELG